MNAIERGLSEKMNAAYAHLEDLIYKHGMTPDRAWERIILSYSITDDDVDNFVQMTFK